MVLTSRFGLVGSVLNSWRFGLRFFEMVISQAKCRVCQKSQERQVPKSGQIVAKMWALISPCAFSNALLQMQALNSWQSPDVLAHKWGGGGGPPWGSSMESTSQKPCDFSFIFVRCFSFFQSSIFSKYAFYLCKMTIFHVFAKF